MLTAGVVEIRPEQSADHQSVLAVHAAAFADHGGVVINLVKALRDLALTLQDRLVLSACG